VPKGEGPSLGAAVKAFIADVHKPPAGRSVKQQLHYLLSVRTGATDRRIAQLLGVKPARVRAWASGKTVPTKANREKTQAQFEKFWEINHRRARLPDGMMKISAEPKGAISVNDKPRSHLMIEPNAKRGWAVIREASEDQITDEEFHGQWFTDTFPIEIPYVTFDAGYYTLETV
jgi:hypothetical protein